MSSHTGNLLSYHIPSKNFKIKMHKAIILPVVLYGCETWSLTLREDIKLRALRRIFRPKREGREERVMRFITCMLHQRRMRWTGHAARMEAIRNIYILIVGKPEGKRPPGRPRRRWKIILELMLDK
jgi:hypothetical protein